MEYLDPKKQKRHRLFLWIGYALVVVGIGIGCVVLLWQAYGYSYKNGQVIQNGMVFLSSQPNPASIYIDGKLNSATTNTRLTIPSGVYNFELKEPGYRPWKHVIPVFGDQVEHYDYPFLFPIKLNQTSVAKYTQAPAIASQSPSQQYLVVSSPTDFYSFLMYDLTNPKAQPVTLTLPTSLLTPATGTQSWQVVGWADDNQHLLLEHLYDGTQEYIELDTQNPNQSVNLNKTYNVNPTSVTLNNLKYNHYYFYDASTQTLSAATLGNTTLKPVETGVISYKSYNSNELLYTTATGAPSGQVAVEISDGSKDYLVRYLPQSQTYLLNMAGYNGDDYAAIGASSSNFLYIYKDPLSQATASNKAKIVPFLAMKISGANYLSFSPTAQFIMAENGTTFAVYDIFNDTTYHYDTGVPLDAPQAHAVWMDGDRLIYVSGGKLTVADYDDTNRQTLTPALPSYAPFFAPDYQSYFSIAQDQSSAVELYQTSLLASS